MTPVDAIQVAGFVVLAALAVCLIVGAIVLCTALAFWAQEQRDTRRLRRRRLAARHASFVERQARRNAEPLTAPIDKTLVGVEDGS